MQELTVTLHQCITRTPNVQSFRFNINEKLDFLAGQFVQIIFDIENRQNKNLNKYLSISNSPGKNYIEVTKKLTDSDFSSKLRGLKEGDTLLLRGPFGKCVYGKDGALKIGFLIGGIGVTPAISILEYIVEEGLSIDVLMVYGNWSEKDIAFKDEMDEWVAKYKNIKIVHVLVSDEGASKNYLTGMIDVDLLKNYAPDLSERFTYIFGPPKMVDAVKIVCEDVGCKKNKILAESFMGY